MWEPLAYIWLGCAILFLILFVLAAIDGYVTNHHVRVTEKTLRQITKMLKKENR